MSFQKSFKALSDPIRREILALLRAGPMAAGEIVAHFHVSGATVSHHLSILRDAGLVLGEKKGKHIYYELNMSVVDEILGWFTALKGDSGDEKIRENTDIGMDSGDNANIGDRSDVQPSARQNTDALGF